MDEIRRERGFVRKALIVALVLSIVLSPFFYHLMSFVLVPIVIITALIFSFVFFTGLTDFERKKMIILNIVFSVVVILLYEGYLFYIVTSGTHNDIHLNMTIWLVQVLAVNFLFILYQSIKSLKKRRELENDEQIDSRRPPFDR